MAAEPVTFFSHKRDPAGVVESVRAVAPEMQLIGDGAAWDQIVIPGQKRFLRREPSFVISHDPDYYAEPNWSGQIAGMTEYLRSWPRNGQTAAVLSLLPALRFALAVGPDTPVDMDDPGDRWANVVRAVAKRLDAVLFTPSTLRDANGRVIISADGDSDPAATVPHSPTTR